MTHDATPPAMAESESERALRRELEVVRGQVTSLETELHETNRGVLALYAELDTQAQQLRSANDLKSRFLSYMSHEFRTPIASVRSLARLLLDRVDGPLTEEQEKQVTFIQSTAAEFSEMVDDLLDLAKVEAGRIEISPEWFQLVDLFSALRGMFKPLVVNPAVVLVFDELQNSRPLYSDDKKLSQILRNFISNALKFTVKGEVRVSAVQHAEESMTFSVRDTGIGIDARYHHAIFQDFSQLDSPIQKRLRGTGLGLSLSKRLAELLGGSVHLESELGVGSTFYLTVPLQLPDSAVRIGAGRTE